MSRAMLSFAFLGLLLSASLASAQASQQAGEATRITVRYQTESESDGSTSSSRGSFRYIERVLAVTDAGTELEYSIPTEDSEQDRRADWQFPVRILLQPDGEAILNNREELIIRRDQFLEDADLAADACGSWIFTWNAFKIDCHPDSIIDVVMGLRLQPRELADGALITLPPGDRSAVLSLVSVSAERSVYRADFPVDPDAVRRSAAESDVAVGEIIGEPTTLEEALERRSQDQVSGTITVTLQAGPTGMVDTRIEETSLEYKGAGEETEYRHSVWGIRREPL